MALRRASLPDDYPAGALVHAFSHDAGGVERDQGDQEGRDDDGEDDRGLPAIALGRRLVFGWEGLLRMRTWGLGVLRAWLGHWRVHSFLS
jgi:hypothetical protein